MSYPSMPSIRAFDADTAYHIFSTYVWPVALIILVAKWRRIESALRLDKYLQSILATNLVAAAFTYLILTTMTGFLAIYLSLLFTIMTAFVLSANIYFKRSYYYFKLNLDAKWQKRREAIKQARYG